jgi:hypothetical protein
VHVPVTAHLRNGCQGVHPPRLVLSPSLWPPFFIPVCGSCCASWLRNGFDIAFIVDTIEFCLGDAPLELRRAAPLTYATLECVTLTSFPSLTVLRPCGARQNHSLPTYTPPLIQLAISVCISVVCHSFCIILSSRATQLLRFRATSWYYPHQPASRRYSRILCSLWAFAI